MRGIQGPIVNRAEPYQLIDKHDDNSYLTDGV